jgi:hypothetical protein
MIAADKEALQTTLKQQALQIQEKELSYYTNNFNSLSTSSSLIAGFSFGALASTSDAGGSFIAAFFYVCTTLSFGFNLLVVINCTFVTMWGPGMALRGPDGSMQKAVEGMQAQRTHTFIFFALGLVFLNLGLIGISWVNAVWYNALLVTFISMYFLQLFGSYTKQIWSRFKLVRAMLCT